MLICLKQLYHNSIYHWNSEKTELEFVEKGDLVINTDEISTVEPERMCITRACTEEMPEEFRNKFNNERPPIVSKITLKNERQFLVKESPKEISDMLSEEK